MNQSAPTCRCPNRRPRQGSRRGGRRVPRFSCDLLAEVDQPARAYDPSRSSGPGTGDRGLVRRDPPVRGGSSRYPNPESRIPAPSSQPICMNQIAAIASITITSEIDCTTFRGGAFAHPIARCPAPAGPSKATDQRDQGSRTPAPSTARPGNAASRRCPASARVGLRRDPEG